MQAIREGGSSRSRSTSESGSAQGSTQTKAKETPKKERKETQDGFDSGGARRAARPPPPETASPDKAKPKDELDDPALKLTDDEKKKIRAARDGVHDSDRDVDSPRRPHTIAGHTEAILRQSRSMDVEARSAILKRLAAATPTEVRSVSESLDELTKSPAVRDAPSEQQKEIARVAQGAGTPGLAALRDLCVNQPGKLQVQDKDGKTTLDNLATLATEPLHADLVNAGVTRASILDSAMQEVADPNGMVDQHMYNTCSVTSCQYEIARDDPSEYVRVLAALAGPTGQAPMRNGDSLSLQTGYLAPKPGDTRSPTEIMFQSAAMKYTLAPWFDYDAAKDANHLLGIIPVPAGAYETRFLSAFTGKPYDNVTLDNPALNSLGLSFLETQRPRDPGVDPVILNIFTAPDQGGRHSVTFLEAHDGRVYFRNQWNEWDKKNPQGANVMLGWRAEDPKNSVYSMSYEDFARNCYGFSASEAALAAWNPPDVPVDRSAGSRPDPVRGPK